VISADLEALTVLGCSGEGAGQGREGFGPGLNFSISPPKVPYQPLDLELVQLFLELAGEVRKDRGWGRSAIQILLSPLVSLLLLYFLPSSLSLDPMSCFSRHAHAPFSLRACLDPFTFTPQLGSGLLSPKCPYRKLSHTCLLWALHPPIAALTTLVTCLSSATEP
jgi:hypothetical protein